MSEKVHFPAHKEQGEIAPVISRDHWTDINFDDDPLVNGMINDLMRCSPCLQTLGHRYVHLDANAMFLIAEELAPRIREYMREYER